MSDETKPQRTTKFYVWVGITVLGLLVAGAGFVFKLVEFIKVAMTGDAGGFALVPVVTYFLVTAGFICVFMWNYLRGGLHNVEQPKFDMLKRNEEIDRHDGFAPPVGH